MEKGCHLISIIVIIFTVVTSVHDDTGISIEEGVKVIISI